EGAKAAIGEAQAAAELEREAGLTGLTLHARRRLEGDDMLVFRRPLGHTALIAPAGHVSGYP
ncbi:MAG TPA: hypothetical protein P5114_06660, partial [Hyphomicrobiaceae bacterium]|nr:hypothetical protein [Hyphomicrobiaceae bacterium]